MLDFLLPFAHKIVDSAIKRIPDNAQLGEQLIEICLDILAKAVKMTNTDADDALYETVARSIRSR